MLMMNFDIPLCHIPAATYPIGDASRLLSRPVHAVTLSDFQIMQYAVSNELFAKFVSAGGYRSQPYWSQAGWRWKNSKAATHPAFWGDANFDANAQPVIGICWYEALAFANWLSAETQARWTLPTEPQWEAAARGLDANGSGTPHSAGRSTIPVTDARHTAWCGAINLLGNVWEWCSTRWGRNWQTLGYPYPYDPADGREDLSGSHARVMRGGSWYDYPRDAHPSQRARYLPGSRASNIGLRLVRNTSS